MSTSKHAAARLRRATALALAVLLTALPVSAGVSFQVTQGLTLTGADGIFFENPNGLTLTGADGYLAFDANGITRVGSDGLTLTGADWKFTARADGVSYTGSNSYVATRADGLTLTGADGLTLTGADGLTLTGADGTMHQVNSVVFREPAGLTLTGADGLTLTGADGVEPNGSDGLTLTGADGLTLTGADSVTVNTAGQAVVTTTDGQVLSVSPNGLTLTGADMLRVVGAENVAIYGVQGFSLAGADGLPLAGPENAPNSGLMSLDPELALMLDRMSDDSNVNAVIVYHRPVTETDILTLQAIGVLGGTRYQSLPMVAVTTTKRKLDIIADLAAVRTIYGARTLEWSAADNSREQTGLLRARSDSELLSLGGGLAPEGDGVTVAVLDTGVDATHEDIAGRVVSNVKLADFQGSQIGFSPPLNVEGFSTTDQASGHGTFVGGIIAGAGTKSGGKFRGYAPKARLVGLSAGDASLFNVLAGFDYLLSNPSLGVRVVNCSFSANTVYDENDPVNVATRMLVERGVNVVFSAGNTGPGLRTLNPYAAAPWVISVGATDGATGRLANFSSRGEFASRTARPTLVAPGVSVVSLRASGTNVTGTTGLPADLTQLTPSELQHYTSASGTSFSAPAVAGTIALMLGVNPSLTPAGVRDILQRTATPTPAYYRHEAGAGALNSHAAVLDAAFPDRHIGYFRATLDRGQVRFIREASQIFEKTLAPGTSAQSSFAVPKNAVYVSSQVAWGPVVSPNDLGMSLADASGAVRAESNYLNLPGLTGKRERVFVPAPEAGEWRVRVYHTLGAGFTSQGFRGVFETARVDYAPTTDTAKLDPATQANIRTAVRTFTMWPDGARFRPGGNVKRYELAEALVSAGRAPQYMPGVPTFRDVTDRATMNFVESAHRLFPDARPGSNFRPDVPTSRLVAAVALVRAAGLQSEAEANMTTPLDVPDVAGIPTQYRGYVFVALSRGLMSPLSGKFRHNRDLTRAELAQGLAALLKL
ncbi:MAG TPA: S8 family serine peptidase [Pyrinomonadaceae bacterium]|nr:S8 family serine peptidase [Pyrinomonadaceae bacterium]